MPKPDALSFFLISVPGLAPVVADEARAAGFKVTAIEPGGVTLSGPFSEVIRANRVLRGPTRVLLRIAEFRALHLAQLDKRARRIPWDSWLPPGAAVSVDATCRKSRIYHAKAATERVENALVGAGYVLDRKTGLSVKLRIEDDLAVFSLDTSGVALHKRGHKPELNKAPMRETLAALFLQSAGYDGRTTVLDPMCGSGTFVIEAAEMALGLPPGRSRSFAFEQFAGVDAAPLPMPACPTTDIRVFGSDRDEGATRISTGNAVRAGVDHIASFETRPIADVSPPDAPPGLVIVNPPYGGRIGKTGALKGLYASFGQVMRDRFPGWRIALIASDGALARTTGLPWDAPGPVVDHGGIKVRLWQCGL